MSGSSLRRSLGVGDAVTVGLGAMLGAGVFAAWAPAASAAGTGMLLAVVLAGAVATCNALSSAALAVRHPVAGGTYVYGRERLGPLWGYLAGWMFVVGKCASCAAMAMTAASYLAPGRERVAAGRRHHRAAARDRIERDHAGAALRVGLVGLAGRQRGERAVDRQPRGAALGVDAADEDAHRPIGERGGLARGDALEFAGLGDRLRRAARPPGFPAPRPPRRCHPVPKAAPRSRRDARPARRRTRRPP